VFFFAVSDLSGFGGWDGWVVRCTYLLELGLCLRHFRSVDVGFVVGFGSCTWVDVRE
jgi:hypothetical protein